MRFLTLITFFYTFSVQFSLSQDAGFDWGISTQGSGLEYIESIVADDNGNVFAVGYFDYTVDVDPGPDVYELDAEGPYDDIFILKLNADGEFLWCKVIQGVGSSNAQASSIALDSEANLIITGNYQEGAGVDFDPSADEYILTASTPVEGFLLKLNSDGEFIWVKRFRGEYFVRPTEVVVDESNNLYLSGDFHEWMDADPGPEGFPLYADTPLEHGLFIIKLDSEANFVWAASIDGEAIENRIQDLEVDDAGNVVVVGVFRETADFDPGVDIYNFTSTSYENSFILKLNSSGEFVWAKQITGVGPLLNALDIDSEGSIYNVGDFTNADFDPGDDEYFIEAIGERDGFIQKLSTDGDFIYVQRLASEGLVNVKDVFLNESSEPCIVGYFHETVDFDPGPEILEFTATDDSDGFILLLDSDGNLNWVKQIRGDFIQRLTHININLDQKIYVLGELRGLTEFGSDLELEYSGYSQNDAFILRLSGCSTTGVTNHILSCDSSYTWIDGETYTESNYSATYSYDTDGVCDSLVTLNLTFAHLDNEINVSGITMNVSVLGVEYQWLDCDNDYIEIAGEVGVSYTPSIDGNYCVRIQQGECVDTSDCITIEGAGISKNSEDLELKIFPNPSNGLINIHLNEISNGGLLRVYSSNGNLLKEISNIGSYDKFKFELSVGTYFIQFVSDESSHMYQFVVL